MSRSSTTTADDTKQTPVLLLDDVLKGNSTTATRVVDMLMEVRGSPKMEEYLKDMLPQDSYPIWTKLPLVSKGKMLKTLKNQSSGEKEALSLY